MLTTYAADIAVIISSLIASLCFTFAEPFDNIFLFKSSCALVSRNTNKSLRPKEGRIDRPTNRPTNRPSEWIRGRSLDSYFAFCKIVVKTGKWTNNWECLRTIFLPSLTLPTKSKSTQSCLNKQQHRVQCEIRKLNKDYSTDLRGAGSFKCA